MPEQQSVPANRNEEALAKSKVEDHFSKNGSNEDILMQDDQMNSNCSAENNEKSQTPLTWMNPASEGGLAQ